MEIVIASHPDEPFLPLRIGRRGNLIIYSCEISIFIF